MIEEIEEKSIGGPKNRLLVTPKVSLVGIRVIRVNKLECVQGAS